MASIEDDLLVFDFYENVSADDSAVVTEAVHDVFEFFFGDDKTDATFFDVVTEFVDHAQVECCLKHDLQLMTLASENAEVNRQALDKICVVLPQVVWKPEHHTALIVTPGDVATFVAPHVTLIACSTLNQLADHQVDFNSLFETNVLPASKWYVLWEDGDDEKYIHQTRDEILHELDSSVAEHVHAWKAKYKIHQNATLCPATVSAALKSMAQTRSQEKDNLAAKATIIDVSDSDFVILSSTVSSSDVPRHLRWKLFCATVRELLQCDDKVVTCILTTFLIKILLKGVSFLHTTIVADEESAPDSKALPRQVGLDLRRRLFKRQQALEHCASHVASDLHSPAFFAHITRCTDVLENTMKTLQLLDARSAMLAQHKSSRTNVNDAASDCKASTYVFVFEPQAPIVPIPSTKLQKFQSLSALPTTLRDKPAGLRWPNSQLCCLQIEQLACDALDGGLLHSRDVLHEWWDQYDQRILQNPDDNGGWFPASTTKTSSRRLVVGLIFWYLIDESLKIEFSETASKFTTIPAQVILAHLKTNIADIHSRIHQTTAKLIKLIDDKLKHTSYAWQNPLAFGEQLAHEMPGIVRQYESEKRDMTRQAEFRLSSALAKRRELEQLQGVACPGECQNHRPSGRNHGQFDTCLSCILRAAQCEAIKNETTQPLHMPYGSAAIACLCNLPQAWVSANRAATRCLALLPGHNFHNVTNCNASGHCVMQGGRWMQDLRLLRGIDANVHIHCQLLGARKTVDVQRVEDIFKVAVNCVSAVAFDKLADGNCFPITLRNVNSVTMSASDVAWAEEHPKPFADDHTKHVEMLTTRGNIAHTKNVLLSCRQALQLPRRDTVAVLGSVRSFVEMQHRMALQVILNGNIDGYAVAYDSLAIGRILLLAASHTAGCLNKDHTTYLAQLRNNVLEFIASTTAPKSCSLVLIAQQYGMLFARVDDHVLGCEELHEIGAAVLRASIKRAFKLLGDALDTPLRNGNLASQWEAVRRGASIVQAICAFIPHCWREAHRFGAFTKAYVFAVVFGNVARQFIHGTPCAMCVRLEPFQVMARHCATRWLPIALLGHEDATLLPLIRRLDPSLPLKENPHSRWAQVRESLLVYDGEVMSGDDRNTFKLNLFSGEVFVNDIPLTGLPSTITAGKAFIQLFGNRNYLVQAVSGAHGWYRASADFGMAGIDLDGNSVDASQSISSRSLFFEFSLNHEIVFEEIVRFHNRAQIKLRFRLHALEPITTIRNRKHFVWCSENLNPAVNLYRPVPVNESQAWLDDIKVASRVAVVGLPFNAVNIDAVSFGAVRYHSIPLLHQSKPLFQLTSASYLESLTKIEPTPTSVEEILAPFEDNAARITFLVDGDRRDVFLEHFQTSFKVSDDGFIWADDVDYQLSDNQSVSWLPCCHQYLRLTLRSSTDESQLKPKELVLLPLGFVNKGHICEPTGFVVKTWLHEHFGYIECDSFAGRILLATLLTFGNSGVLCNFGESHHFQTAHIEHITTLLRRSFLNVPWTDVERQLMQRLREINLSPSVHLLCAALERYSMPHDAGTAPTVDTVFNTKNSVSRMFSQYCVSLKKSSMHRCCVLEEDELNFACNNTLDCSLPLNTFIGSKLLWNVCGVPIRCAFKDDIKKCIQCCAKVYETLTQLLTSTPTEMEASTAKWLPTVEDLSLRSDVAQGIAESLHKSLISSWNHSAECLSSPSAMSLSVVLQDIGRALACVEQRKSSVLESLREFNDSLFLQEMSAEKKNHPHNNSLMRLLRMSHRVERVHQHHIAYVVAANSFHSHLLSFLEPETKRDLLYLCTSYTILCCDGDSLVRVQHHLKSYLTMNSEARALEVEILREVTSPRRAITAHKAPWIVLEAEQRIRIRKVQFETWDMLMNDCPQVVTQLNMGEGKTRVIIPMMILSEARNKHFVCVHALSSVIQEYGEAFIKSLSTPGLRMCPVHVQFNRDVDVSTHSSCYRLQRSTTSFRRRYCLIARECATSLVVKHEEGRLEGRTFQQFTTLNTICGGHSPNESLHIFDEVDELLRFDYSLVYATGQQEPLPLLQMRGEVIQRILTILSELLAADAAARAGGMEGADAIESEFVWSKERTFDRPESFPGAYTTQPRLSELLTMRILQTFLKSPAAPCAWMSAMDSQTLERFVTDDTPLEQNAILSVVGIEEHFEHLMLLRGLFAHDVLGFILNRRPQENYGIPPTSRRTLLAVPYEAADTPSQRSDFAQPDVCIGLTFLAYFHRGLTCDQFHRALRVLVEQPPALRIREARLWQPLIRTQAVSFPTDGVVDLNDVAMVNSLYDDLHDTIPVIAFWVRFCVLEQECKHFPTMLMGSAWDIANVPRAVGFSGTSDAQCLLPEIIRFKHHPSKTISGATGKMIRLVISHTEGIVETIASVPTSGRSEMVVRHALSQQCQVVIDIGGLFAGADLATLARNACKVIPKTLEGVCFFNGATWVAVAKTTFEITELRFSHLTAEKCLVLFDQARCRGADLRLATNARALLTLGEDTTKDAFMQAVGRLRQFGCSQTIRIAAQHAVVRRLGNDLTINGVLRLLITNTCVSLSRGLPVFVRAASHFAKKQAKLAGSPIELFQASRPSELYSGGITLSTVGELVERENLQESEAGARALDLGKAHSFIIQGSNEQTAEREVAREVEQENEQEVETAIIHPLQEKFNAELVFALKFTSVPAIVKQLNLCKEIALDFNVPDCLFKTPNFSAIANDVYTQPLRRVNTLVALGIHPSDNVVFWVSEFEAAAVLHHWTSLRVRHLPPDSMGGLTVLHNYESTDPLPQCVAEAIVFTMLFNGQSMFDDNEPRPTWLPARDDGGPSSLYGYLLCLLKDGVSKEGGSTFLKRRNLEAEFFRASDLERAIGHVSGRRRQ